MADITIPEELLTRWAESCLSMNHHGTIIQQELPKTAENARALELAERARRRAWDLFNDLLHHGANKPENYCEPNDDARFLLGKIEIDGTKASLDKLASVALIPDGKMKQLGLKAKVPPQDTWCYSSPIYRFRFDESDQEIYDFLTAHLQVGKALAARDTEIEYAFFTLVPVEQSYEGSFSGIFSCETLKLLADMGLELQISPESMMPDAPYWKP